MNRMLAMCALLIAVATWQNGFTAEPNYRIVREKDAVIVKAPTGNVLLHYQLERPAGSKLAVESGCYFHPVATPAGTIMTDVAPADHLHHRGVFLAWVEMHGKKDADFWGWGEHAPKKGRRIVNQTITGLSASATGAGFRARNDWLAEDDPVLSESLNVSNRVEASAHIVDLVYSLVAQTNLTLARWAFSGFCARLRQGGQLEVTGSEGPVNLPNPQHTEPNSDWPAARWYDFTLRFDDGKVAGLAVMDHPKNPPSLWHNHRALRMLNPCIVAPAAVVLKANQPLVLRYRVVAHDGPTPRPLLERLAQEWE